MAPSLDVIHGAIGGTPFFDDILLLGGVHGTDCGKMIDMNEKTSVPQNQSWLQGAPPSPPFAIILPNQFLVILLLKSMACIAF